MNGEMVLNDIGNMIEKWWNKIPEPFNMAKLDVFQIMPNHVHFVLIIYRRRGIACNAQPNTMCNAQYDVGFARKTPTFGTVTTGSLSCVIRSFKSECTKQIRRIVNNPNMIIWQRNYYEHIIKNETEYIKIKRYIQSNPSKWKERNGAPFNSNWSLGRELVTGSRLLAIPSTPARRRRACAFQFQLEPGYRNKTVT
ncbi:hypothetical protein A3H26_00160 [candidate division WWE3 bacterium RIFCSPLOWO2_12_FULL_36_10]|uniref:Transposase IS200-like domain-containing protein n=1 Tax=candidate division WWE3 bacterium RIFCSPLOWO2_12_FULL_36_10 TaxID=1802630 RepID=A0A1F4VIL6_UNCKA|nr:MAG: hypothetical protein A3H26_00160 [candidate division WWE3 bacterium RIFCSPLOWO2_12_FULL_36_10]